MRAYELVNKLVTLTKADRESERKYVGRTVRVTGAISSGWVTIDLDGDNRKWLWNVNNLQVVEERLNPIEQMRREIDRDILKQLTEAADKRMFDIKVNPKDPSNSPIDFQSEPAVKNAVPTISPDTFEIKMSKPRDGLRKAADNLEKAAEERKLTTPQRSLEEDLREIDRKYDKEVEKIHKDSWSRRGRLKRQADVRARVMSENKTDELLDKYIASNRAGDPDAPFRGPRWFTWKRLGLVAGLVGTLGTAAWFLPAIVWG